VLSIITEALEIEQVGAAAGAGGRGSPQSRRAQGRVPQCRLRALCDGRRGGPVDGGWAGGAHGPPCTVRLQEFITDALPVDLIGMNSKLMRVRGAHNPARRSAKQPPHPPAVPLMDWVHCTGCLHGQPGAAAAPCPNNSSRTATGCAAHVLTPPPGPPYPQEYLEFVCDRLLVALGCEKHYRTSNPFDWMEIISLQVGGGRDTHAGHDSRPAATCGPRPRCLAGGSMPSIVIAPGRVL